MLFLRSPRPDTSRMGIEASREAGLTTLEASGFDPKKSLIIGGLALAFAGIRAAHDVDLALPQSSLRQTLSELRTPSGLILREHPDIPTALESFYLTGLPDDALPLDITTLFLPPEKILDVRRTAFTDEQTALVIAKSPRYEGWAYLSPEDILAYKRSGGGLRPKDRADIKLIENHLNNPRTIPSAEPQSGRV